MSHIQRVLSKNTLACLAYLAVQAYLSLYLLDAYVASSSRMEQNRPDPMPRSATRWCG